MQVRSLDQLNREFSPLHWGKNAIINGDFRLADYATSQVSSGYGSLNRWKPEHQGSTKTASQQAFAVGQTDVPGEPEFFARQVVISVTGASNYVVWRYRIEDVRTFAEQTCTLGLWSKADAAKNVSIEFRQYFGAGGSATVSALGIKKHAVNSGWAKLNQTVTLPSISGKTLGIGHALEILIYFDAGSTFNASTDTLGHQSGTFDIANVQLEAGYNATDFERRPLAVERFLCLPYLRRISASAASHRFAVGAVNAVNSGRFVIDFGVPMRGPTVFTYSTLGDFNVYDSSILLALSSLVFTDNDDFTGGSLVATTSLSTLNLGRAAQLTRNSGTPAYLQWESEL